MRRTSISICRKILQVADENTIVILPDSSFSPITAVSGARSPFDASVALSLLVILVIAAALFFLFFFSFYIRHFESAAPDHVTAAASSSASRLRRRPAPTGGKGGLDASAINSLPVVTYGGSVASTDDGCAICLSDFRERETVKIIPYCGHVFHKSCVDRWLASHVTCPMCRSRQLFKGVEEVRVDETRREGNVGEAAAAEYGGAGMMRTCSLPDLANRAVLERSTSF